MELMKARLFKVLEATAYDRTSRIVGLGLGTLIILNVTAVIVGTVEPIYARHRLFLDWFEVFSVAVFTAEYLLRLYACTSVPEYRHPFFGRLRYAVTPLALVDLIAILPFYLPLLHSDLRSLRILRVLRVLRLAKLIRYSDALRLLGKVVRSKKEELVMTMLLLVFLLIMASTAVYHAEHESQPEHFSSIPAAMWWGIATLSTVGYGDVYPITPVGRMFGAVAAILGIAMFALPTGLLGAGFLEEIQKRKRTPKPCPHCGREIE